MSEKENLQKTDLLSNIRSQKPKIKEKQNEEHLDDNIWNEISDEDDDTQVSKISSKLVSNLIIKEENQKKKYSNLKDIMGESNNGNNTTKKNHQKKPMVNVKDKDPNSINKPVFVNSNKFYNKNENFTRNYDDDFNKKQGFQNKYKENFNTERPKFFSNKPHDNDTRLNTDNNGLNNKYNYNSNLVYQNQTKNEKEETMKRVGNFSSLVKDFEEENKRIKAPNRDYTEIDFNKDKFRSEKTIEKFTLQKPHFVSSHQEEPKFVELNKDQDLFFKNVSKIESQNKQDNQNFEPTKYTNSKKEKQFTKENSSEIFQEENSNNDMISYKTENKKFWKPRDDFEYFESLINPDQIIFEKKSEVAHINIDLTINTEKTKGLRKSSDVTKKINPIEQKVTLVQTKKTLKDLLSDKK